MCVVLLPPLMVLFLPMMLWIVRKFLCKQQVVHNYVIV